MLLPSSRALAGFLVASCLVALSKQHFYGGVIGEAKVGVGLQAAGGHVGVGVVVLGVLLPWVYKSERETLRQLVSLRKRGGDAKEE
jgi:hypothetical protein